MKRILLSLIIAAPICAMQPENKKTEKTNVSESRWNFARGMITGYGVYQAVKPIENIVMTQPTLFPLVATAATVYVGGTIVNEMYRMKYPVTQINNQ